MDEMIPRSYNLAIAWNWEFDADFIAGIERECAVLGLSTYRIDTAHLPVLLADLRENRFRFGAFLDRASDADPGFLPLVRWMGENASCLINPYHRVIHAIDKANMHLEFITNGLYVPSTIILPPYNDQRCVRLEEKELKSLGESFVIKPANTTGGGTGVIMNATGIEEILRARQEHKNDKYLVQELIAPKILDGKRGWFRGYFAFGETLLSWWDDQTHEYTPLTAAEEEKFTLSGLRNAVAAIQKICGLDFFSSEIALTRDSRFVIVDYVNEVCDMRLKSSYFDGAPDTVVHAIEKLTARHIKSHLNL